MEALNEKQLETLAALMEEGPLTTYGLGQTLGIGDTAAKNRAAPLIEEGYVREEWTEETNVKKRIYTITEEGEGAAEEAMRNEKASGLEEVAALGVFSAEERQQMKELADKLRKGD